MQSLMALFENNRVWAEKMRAQDAGYFTRLALQQAPEYLWIGCSDSRVPANQLLGLPPGAVFVHRNVANVVAHGDLNCLSVMQYAIEVLQVKHVILCGHYACGGVRAVQQGQRFGLIDNWLEHVHDVQCRHAGLFKNRTEATAWRTLCELNVIEQLRNAVMTSVVQQAWARGQNLTLHGWIYDVADGLLRDMKVTAHNQAGFDVVYQHAIAAVAAEKTAQ
jgi:carbonic anhydrase